MAISSVYKNHVDGTILFEDASGLALTIQFENGNYKLSGLSEGEYETTEYYDREQLASTRRTKRAIPQLTFDCAATDISDAANKTAMDAIRKKGAFLAGVSTAPGGATAEVWTLKVTFTVKGIIHGDGADHTIVTNRVRFNSDFGEGDPSTFSFSGKVLIFEDADISMT